MAKTYVPTAVQVADTAHKYLTRYQAQLSKSATSEQIAALVELIACLAAFATKWFKPPPVN